MKRQYLSKNILPDSSGIYIFRDSRKRPLYIGRATSLKNRVKSYFSADVIKTRGPRIVDMVTKAKSITYQETDSVLEAVLLESKLIKKYQPYYNVDERDDRSAQYVVITDEDWPRVFVVRVRDFDQYRKDRTLPYEVKNIFGPFVHSGLIHESLKILRKMFPFRDKHSYDPRHEAFYRSIGKSPQMDGEQARMSYLNTIKYLTLFFDGNKKRLRIRIEQDMHACARKMEFEEAGKLKKLLHAIDHINDIALLKREHENSSPRVRIEAYDIAHLSGSDTVGAMTVCYGGELQKAEYRRFKISRDRNDDFANLAELISRRLNHPEWQYPDVIVVDGNINQVRIAENILKSRRINIIGVVGVTKDEHHKAAKIIGDRSLVYKYRTEIVMVNAEAHRFAIRYHRDRRNKRFE